MLGLINKLISRFVFNYNIKSKNSLVGFNLHKNAIKSAQLHIESAISKDYFSSVNKNAFTVSADVIYN